MNIPVVIFWFRRDLRLHDNAGLHAALQSGLPVVPVFIFDEAILKHLQDKDDKRVSFIYAALEAMQATLTVVGATLDVRYGCPDVILNELLLTYNVAAVYTNHDYEPYAAGRDGEIKKLLAQKSIAFHTFKDQVIFERDEVVKDDGKGYTVFTPYANKWRQRFHKSILAPFDSQDLLTAYHHQPLRPLPTLAEMGFTFNAAIPAISQAEAEIIKTYHQTRNTPSVAGTTRMGVHLRFGTVSIRELMTKALELNETYLTELIWREFFMQVLWHQPRIEKEACKKEYDSIVFRNNEEEFSRWCNGQTGCPIVDAGIRELNATGFMHNRVRMIAGSFLVKDLLIDWRWGEAYFARKLLDFELAANNGNWQWVAGSGCDAAPYFRVFNPTIQQKKFDPQLLYIKKWIPEYGTPTYPKLMVDHSLAKERCLTTYKAGLAKARGYVES